MMDPCNSHSDFLNFQLRISWGILNSVSLDFNFPYLSRASKYLLPSCFPPSSCSRNKLCRLISRLDYKLLILDDVLSTCSPSFPASNLERTRNSVETTREEFIVARYHFAHFSSRVYLVIPVQDITGFPNFPM